MAKTPQTTESEAERKIGRLSAWVRLLAVLFRVLIILGLTGIVIILILLLAVSHIKVWLLLIPVFALVLGLVLARSEYRLYNRLYEMEHDTHDEE